MKNAGEMYIRVRCLGVTSIKEKKSKVLKSFEDTEKEDEYDLYNVL